MTQSLLFNRCYKLTQVIRSTMLLKALLFHGVLAGVEHRQIFSKTLSTVVDIGANRGQFALAARKWAPSARIISFEPLKAAANIFRKVFQMESGVVLHQAAIGPRAGEAIIHIAASDDSSSILPITRKQTALFPGTKKIGTEKVSIGPLSNYVAAREIVQPAMLKLDVQGYELEALRGCRDLLDRFSLAYVECSFVELYSGQALADDIVAWLRERGWCFDGIYNMNHDSMGACIQADFLFKRSIAVNGA
jgi:FkbM family methyltransferase